MHTWYGGRAHACSHIMIMMIQTLLPSKGHENENENVKKRHALDWLNERGCILCGAFQPIECVLVSLTLSFFVIPAVWLGLGLRKSAYAQSYHSQWKITQHFPFQVWNTLFVYLVKGRLEITVWSPGSRVQFHGSVFRWIMHLRSPFSAYWQAPNFRPCYQVNPLSSKCAFLLFRASITNGKLPSINLPQACYKEITQKE